MGCHRSEMMSLPFHLKIELSITTGHTCWQQQCFGLSVPLQIPRQIHPTTTDAYLGEVYVSMNHTKTPIKKF